ncbi:MAG: AlwI family type II restriction endonuclease [Anaerovoracaceae bacterium]
MANFPYKSYCWCIGTTSYRTEHFNLSNEQQISLMNEFKSLPQNINTSWREQQSDYYYFLKDNNFLTGEAERPDKDAREKTSGLVDIGLLDGERNLSNAGKALLEICENKDFTTDNFLEIDKDSFIYLKQLLKTYNIVDGNIVRPFVVFAYLETKLGYLTFNEFKYLLPLCVNLEVTKLVEEKINSNRNGKDETDNILIDVMMSMLNYQAAYEYLLSNDVTEELLCDIGMNRKSRNYDKCYFPFYKTLKDVVLNNKTDLLPLYETTKKISGKSKTFWSNYLFKNFNRGGIKKNGREYLTNASIFNAKNEREFKEFFFKTMHLFKMKSTLSDYMDLNRRYFRTTETVIFADSKVEFDIMPECYFSNIADKLLSVAFTESNNLFNDVSLAEISPIFDVDIEKLYAQLGIKVGKAVTTPAEAKEVVKDERYTRFNKLIDEKFSNDVLIDLLDKFEIRDDAYLRTYITDNANAPTMFEYILGIAWYKISDRKGDILDYMNLSLEADLLPKTHAGGGEADIVYLYEPTTYYPKHTLLIEATLAENTGQRVLEMESVSRHIGEYCLKNKDKEAYCVFISTKLLLNLISDFRSRKTTPYFSSNGEDFIDGTKILPLKTTELKTILKKDIKYSNLYPLFEQAYQSTVGVKDWYENEMIKMI